MESRARTRKSVTFNLVLHRNTESSQSVRVLKVASMPDSVGEVKQQVQAQLQIPACCQRIYFETALLSDQDTLHFYRIQENDTLHVHFNSEADVRDIMDIISSLRGMIIFLNSIQDELSQESHLPDLHVRIARAVKSKHVESLAFMYFYPSSTEKADANRRLFIANEGLQLMHKVHLLLLQQPWGRIPIELQYLEHAILRVLWNITASFSVREQVLQRPTLDAIIQSMLRVKIERDKPVSAPRSGTVQHPRMMAMELDRIVSEVVYKAVGTLCK